MDPNKHTVLFVRFDSLRPTNNLSVIKGRVFLGLTSTKLGLMFVAVMPVRLEPGALGLESSTLPLISLKHTVMQRLLHMHYFSKNSVDPD